MIRCIGIVYQPQKHLPLRLVWLICSSRKPLLEIDYLKWLLLCEYIYSVVCKDSEKHI